MSQATARMRAARERVSARKEERRAAQEARFREAMRRAGEAFGMVYTQWLGGWHQLGHSLSEQIERIPRSERARACDVYYEAVLSDDVLRWRTP